MLGRTAIPKKDSRRFSVRTFILRLWLSIIDKYL
jgi:hypothetical protein